MSGPDLVLILRYRKAVTYGFHTLLAALEEHVTGTRYEVVFAESAQATIEAITTRRGRKLVLWSFYSPDAAALAEELATIKEQAPGAVHVAGGVHATAEPVQTLDAGWDVAAVGEGSGRSSTSSTAAVTRPGSPASSTATSTGSSRARARRTRSRSAPTGRFPSRTSG
ncbi:radical SAM protein [Dactylosporangium cerinum]